MKDERTNETSVRGNGETPYLDARKILRDENARARAGERAWQLVACGALLIALAAVGGIAWIGSQSKVVPYVVVTDRLATLLAFGPADKAASPERGAVRAWVLNFIHWTRTVTPDAALQWDFVHGAYSMVKGKDPAYQELVGGWYEASKASRPNVRAEKVIVHVESPFALPVSADTWQVTWTEQEEDRDGRLIRRFPMRAIVTVYAAPPDNATPEAMRFNPFGVYVKTFTWSQTPQ
ncbi:MAG: conjugal transfer protein TrbF [Verrucomicrobia bacterium]|nr:conjugal transfer protein TrbF [Verrucomicrobiota bacterium]